MRRLSLVLLLWPTIALAQFAPQQWPAPQDGSNFACFDVGTMQINSLAGLGVQCVEVDNTGELFPVACSTIGGVSSVTGTAGHVSATPTTGAVVIDLVATAVTPGSYTYAAFTVDADGRLTAASSGTAPITSVTGTSPVSCSGSPVATCSITGGTNQVQVGTGTNIGGTNDFRFDDSIGVTFQSKSQNASTLNFISNSNAGSTAAACTQWSQSGTPNTAPYLQACLVGSGYTGATPGSAFFTHADTIGTQNMTFLEFGSAGIGFNTTTSNLQRLFIENGGNVDVMNLSNNSPVCTASGSPALQTCSGAQQCAVMSSCSAGGDLGGSFPNPTVIALHDGGAVRHPTSGTWANNAPVAIDGSGNVVAKTPGSCITCTGGTCDVFNGQCGGASTLGGVGQVIQQATFDSYGKFQGGNAVSTASLFQSLSYFDVAIQPGGSSGWMATSSTALVGGGVVVEYPLGIAGTKWILNVNVISNTITPGAGNTQFYASINGSIFGPVNVPNSTTGSFTSGATSVVGASTDTWGVFASGTAPTGGNMTCTVTLIVQH